MFVSFSGASVLNGPIGVIGAMFSRSPGADVATDGPCHCRDRPARRRGFLRPRCEGGNDATGAVAGNRDEDGGIVWNLSVFFHVCCYTNYIVSAPHKVLPACALFGAQVTKCNLRSFALAMKCMKTISVSHRTRNRIHVFHGCDCIS